MRTSFPRPPQTKPALWDGFPVALLWFATFLFVCVPTGADELTFEGSFSTAALVAPFMDHAFDPDGIAHDPATGNLFLIDSFEPRVVEVTAAGAFVSTFVPFADRFTEGIDVLPSGNLAICEETFGTIATFTQAGALLGEIAVGGTSPSPSGVAHDGAGGYYVSDDGFGAENIRHLAAAGAVLASIPTQPFDTVEPEGVDFDLASGHIFFVSDDTATLCRITAAGALVDSWDLAALSGLVDSEGVAIDAASSTIWVAFDNDAQVGRFTIPEPAPTLLAPTAAVSLIVRAAARSRRMSFP